MLNQDLRHISDEELLLAADGELSKHRAAEVHDHLEACRTCRARGMELERTITDFAQSHRMELDSQLPSIEGPRALVRSRLRALAREERTQRWRYIFGLNSGVRRRWAYLCAGFAVAAALGGLLFRNSRITSSTVSFEGATRPDGGLTPGATRPVTMSEVCASPREEVIGEVSVSLRQEVFEKYGIVNARPDDYEIDYLITPGLGGAEDVRNLWPEPYHARVWNAHVKDALEERLHELVCSGQVDLSIAQHDIATDWIAAYQKYFHTNKPRVGS
jgi:hypothetical protein